MGYSGPSAKANDMRLRWQWRPNRIGAFVAWGRDFALGMDGGDSKYWFYIGPVGVWLILRMPEKEHQAWMDTMLEELRKPLPKRPKAKKAGPQLKEH